MLPRDVAMAAAGFTVELRAIVNVGVAVGMAVGAGVCVTVRSGVAVAVGNGVGMGVGVGVGAGVTVGTGGGTASVQAAAIKAAMANVTSATYLVIC